MTIFINKQLFNLNKEYSKMQQITHTISNKLVVWNVYEWYHVRLDMNILSMLYYNEIKNSS